MNAQARKLAGELADAIADGDIRHVVELVEAYGLPRAERLGVARALGRPPTPSGEPRLDFDAFDRACLTVSDVWAGG